MGVFSGYGTGQSLRAGSQAYRRAEAIREEQDRYETEQGRLDKQEERMGAQERRSQSAEDRRQLLFEQQQRLMKDEQHRAEYLRNFNKHMAIFKATEGQVYEPIRNFYNEQMPDGGKIITLSRNPEDGTFTYEFDFNGERQKGTNATYDDLGSVFTSIGDPVGFLTAQSEASAKAADHARKMQLAKIRRAGSKASKKDSPRDIYNSLATQYDQQYAVDPVSGLPPENKPDRDKWLARELAKQMRLDGNSEAEVKRALDILGVDDVPEPGGEGGEQGVLDEIVGLYAGGREGFLTKLTEQGVDTNKVADARTNPQWLRIEKALRGDRDELEVQLGKMAESQLGRPPTESEMEYMLNAVLSALPVTPSGPLGPLDFSRKEPVTAEAIPTPSAL